MRKALSGTLRSQGTQAGPVSKPWCAMLTVPAWRFSAEPLTVLCQQVCDGWVIFRCGQPAPQQLRHHVSGLGLEVGQRCSSKTQEQGSVLR